MNPFYDPHGYLNQCHPDLARIAQSTAHLANVAGVQFRVDYGLRTLAAEMQAVATGHSETLHSRHLADAHYGGLAMAFDFYVPGPDGEPDWTDDAPYVQVGDLMLQAAEQLGLKAQWGGEPVGAWTDGVPSNFRDWGHVQLDPSAYP